MKQIGYRKKSHAFTLIELLVVIAIIGILVGLAFPVFNSVRAKGDQVQCVSNLRQIGIAMGSYVNDNNNSLPGPFVYGQTAYYNLPSANATTANMAGYLYPYLTGNNVTTTSQSSTVASMFACPAWKRLVGATPGSTLVCYAENRDLPNPNVTLTTGIDPFGIPNSSSPIRYALVSTLTGLANPTGGAGVANANFSMAQTIMLSDADQINWKNVTLPYAAGFASTLRSNPVHPSARNALFWDFHAESRALTSIP